MISGDRIRQAREYKGFTQAELARRVGVTQARIAHVEGSFKEPSDGLIAAIALQTGFPLAFFSQGPAVEFPIGSLLFRAHASITRKAMTQAHRHAQTLFELDWRLAERTNPIPVGIPIVNSKPGDAARSTRSALGVPLDRPIEHLTRLSEKAGVSVLVLPHLEGCDSFSLWTGPDLGMPVIALSSGRPGDRQRLSLAHELGHLVLHHPGKTKSDDPESEAYQFAAEFLMPECVISQELAAPVTLLSVSRLKRRWGTSMQALIRRARDLSIITERQYHYLFQQLSAKGWRVAEPSNLDVPVEKPRRLRKMAELIYGVPINYEKLAADARLHIQFLKEIMQAYAEKGAVPPSDPAPGKVVSFSRRK